MRLFKHPIVSGIIGVAAFVVAAKLMVLLLMPPALAATQIAITDKITVELGDLPNWVIAFVAAAGLWKAWKAEKKAAAVAAKIDAVAVQIDGLLVARDAAKVAEGEQKVHVEQAAAKEVVRSDAVKDAETKAQVTAIETNKEA